MHNVVRRPHDLSDTASADVLTWKDAVLSCDSEKKLAYDCVQYGIGVPLVE